MDKSEIILDQARILGCDARENEPMSRHTTFKIGGKADAYIKVATLGMLAAMLKECQKTGADYMILGNGSNVLVDDEGIRGVVFRLDGEFRNITLVEEATVFCGAGATLASLCKFALNCGLSGLEFAWGIPGTVGGAVFMNAGAYGGEMKDVVTSVTYLDDELFLRETGDAGMSYRRSRFSDTGDIILSARLALPEDDPKAVRGRMRTLLERRRASQPLELPSAGSTFKRPAGGYAAELIDRAGLKGYAVGGAQVSEKHAGFVVNRGGATFDDVMALIGHIREEVLRLTGIELETEVKIIR